MTRNILAAFVVYIGLLAIFVGLRQRQLTVGINNRVEVATARLVDSNPVAYQHTMFSRILREYVIKSSPDNLKNWTRPVPAYELVMMSPCNPRIRRCS